MKLRHGKIVREGLHTTLTDLRLRKNYKSARRTLAAGDLFRPGSIHSGARSSQIRVVLAARL